LKASPFRHPLPSPHFPHPATAPTTEVCSNHYRTSSHDVYDASDLIKPGRDAYVLPPSDCPACGRRKLLVREDAFRTVSGASKDRASRVVSLKAWELKVTFSELGWAAVKPGTSTCRAFAAL